MVQPRTKQSSLGLSTSLSGLLGTALDSLDGGTQMTGDLHEDDGRRAKRQVALRLCKLHASCDGRLVLPQQDVWKRFWKRIMSTIVRTKYKDSRIALWMWPFAYWCIAAPPCHLSG